MYIKKIVYIYLYNYFYNYIINYLKKKLFCTIYYCLFVVLILILKYKFIINKKFPLVFCHNWRFSYYNCFSNVSHASESILFFTKMLNQHLSTTKFMKNLDKVCCSSYKSPYILILLWLFYFINNFLYRKKSLIIFL